MEYSELIPHFPFDEIRPAQETALQKIADTDNRGRRVSILELPTGSGKSGIAMTMARWASTLPTEAPFVSGASILTVQNILLNQYTEEFEDLVQLKGAGNYSCSEYEDQSCDVGGRLNKVLGTSCPHCPYKAAKYQYIHSPMGVTNFAYFLINSAYQKQLPKRQMLIIDEAHNAEDTLIGHSDIVVSKARMDELNITPPKKLGYTEVGRARHWVLTELSPKIEVAEAALKLEIAAKKDGDRKELSLLLKKAVNLDQYGCRVRRFQNSESELWFINHTEEEINIKPLRGDVFAEELLFSQGKRIVCLSATILEPRVYLRNLGLSPKECGYLSLPSEFPEENRRVRYVPAGSMSFKNYDVTLPKLLKKLEKIFDKHKHEKGIVHCMSFKTMNFVIDHFKGTSHYSRLLSHNSVPSNKVQAILRHTESKEPTILLSPSMMEGLDLRDDLSRFQVIAKAPYKSLADPYIKTRMELDSQWYQWHACLDLIQACGRSIRSKEDYATTYLLDSDIHRLLESGMIPSWWTDSVS